MWKPWFCAGRAVGQAPMARLINRHRLGPVRWAKEVRTKGTDRVLGAVAITRLHRGTSFENLRCRSKAKSTSRVWGGWTSLGLGLPARASVIVSIMSSPKE